jgi:iron complex transport system permease protein
MSAIGGAIILTISDVIGRLIGSPSELEAGIVTAFLGAPILIFIARRAKVRSL